MQLPVWEIVTNFWPECKVVNDHLLCRYKKDVLVTSREDSLITYIVWYKIQDAEVTVCRVHASVDVNTDRLYVNECIATSMTTKR